MESIRLSGTPCVIGLDWQPLNGRKPHAALKAAHAKCYAQHGGAIGLGDQTPPKGAVSLAAVVAAQGDGVFAMPVGDGRVWYAAVQGGEIVPGTDVVLPFEDAVNALYGLHALNRLPVFWAGSEALPGLDTQPLALDALLKRKVGAIKGATTGGNGVGGVVFLLAVVGGIGFAAWKFLLPHEPSPEEIAIQQAQERQARINDYLNQMDAAMADKPASNLWLDAAWRASSRFVPALGGWMLEGYACEPTKCVATYKAKELRLAGPAIEAFGAKAISFAEGGNTMLVTIQLPKLEGQRWARALTERPPLFDRPLLDVLGGLPLFVDAKVDPAASKTTPIAVSAPTDLGFTQVVEDRVALVSQYASAPIILGIASRLADAGFIADKLAVKGDTWRLEVARYGASTGY